MGHPLTRAAARKWMRQRGLIRLWAVAPALPAAAAVAALLAGAAVTATVCAAVTLLLLAVRAAAGLWQARYTAVKENKFEPLTVEHRRLLAAVAAAAAALAVSTVGGVAAAALLAAALLAHRDVWWTCARIRRGFDAYKRLEAASKELIVVEPDDFYEQIDVDGTVDDRTLPATVTTREHTISRADVLDLCYHDPQRGRAHLYAAGLLVAAARRLRWPTTVAAAAAVATAAAAYAGVAVPAAAVIVGAATAAGALVAVGAAVAAPGPALRPAGPAIVAVAAAGGVAATVAVATAAAAHPAVLAAAMLPVAAAAAAAAEMLWLRSQRFWDGLLQSGERFAEWAHHPPSAS